MLIGGLPTDKPACRHLYLHVVVSAANLRIRHSLRGQALDSNVAEWGASLAGHDAEVGSAMAAADDRAELKPRLAGSTSAVREVTVYMHSV